MSEQTPLDVRVRVYVLGTLHLERRMANGRWEDVPPTSEEWGTGHPTRSFLRYLLAHGRCVGRSTILDTLWTDVDSADRYLYNAASTLRRILRSDEQAPLLETIYNRTTYKLADQSRVWVDVDHCTALLQEGKRIGLSSERGLRLLQEAELLFRRGPLFVDEPGDWCFGLREQTKTMQYRCQLWLAEAYEAHQQLAEAEIVVEALLTQDPTDERALRHLMTLLHKQGLTSEAMRRYKQTTSFLKQKGLALSAETEVYVQAIQRGSGVQPLSPFQESSSQESSHLPSVTPIFVNNALIHSDSGTQERPSEMTPTLSPEIISQGILLAIQELERQNMDMDTSRRVFLRTMSTLPALIGTNSLSSVLTTQSLPVYEHMHFFEQELTSRWDMYHTGGTIRAYHGFQTFLRKLEDSTHSAQGTPTHHRALTALCTSYQLEGSLYRDMMKYEEAHLSYVRAFQAAQELDDSELQASALARRGVTCIQQTRSKEAIEYLQEAYSLIDHLDVPYLAGYILQALSEAYAISKQPSESARNIDLAQRALEQRGQVIERSHCEANTTSITAQKGVNAVHLQAFTSAMTLIEQGLAAYNPALVRGRARLKAQEAEAAYGLGLIDACCQDATEAWILARSAGSNKTFTRLRKLQIDLVLSSWKKEQCVIDLNWVMGTL